MLHEARLVGDDSPYLPNWRGRPPSQSLLRDKGPRPTTRPIALLRQIVERVAGEEIRERGAGRAPVAEQVRAAGDGDALRGAEMLEVGDRDGIRRPAFEPLGGVDVVAHLAAAQQSVDAVLPEAVVDEADGQRAADAQRLEDHT